MNEINQEQAEILSTEFEHKTPQEILIWAIESFSPDIGLSSSFQTQSIPLLHMISQIAPETRVYFMNTGYHFWDTLIFREQIQRVWGLNVIDLHPDDTWQVFMRRFGKDLYVTDADLCCYVRKVQPMQKVVDELKAWITGIRRDQTEHRAKAQFLELQKDGLLKINPMLNWTQRDIWQYIHDNGLPEHPLTDRGYGSIGCRPCTRPIMPGEDERSGRWIGLQKTECGLHTDMFELKGRDPDEVMKSFLFHQAERTKDSEE
jgi:phosphoadenosine phosphosulfate reductase